MNLKFEKIIRIKKIRVEKSGLSEEERTLSKPILTDKSLIKTIYRYFVDPLNDMNCPPHTESVIQRKKFIFIILYLYSPSTLAGGKMKSGLRDEISKVLGVQSMSTISNNCSDVVFLYQNYSDFSSDIAEIYSHIMSRLISDGIIEEIGI